MKLECWLLGCIGLFSCTDDPSQTDSTVGQDKNDSQTNPDSSDEQDDHHAGTDIYHGQIQHVLFVAIDDLKPLLSCYGDELAQTPNFERLAQRAVVFESAYCQEAISAATRASLLTGWCPDKTRVRDLKTYIRDKNPEVVTVPQFFRQLGWKVTGIGKIFDPRSVHDYDKTASWDKYISNTEVDKEREKLGVESFAHYVDPQTVAEGKKYLQEAFEKGINGYKAREYALSKCKPSTECIEVPDEYYSDGAIARLAVKEIKEHEGSEHFFFAVGFTRPHLPFVAPKKYWDCYQRASLPLAFFHRRAEHSPKCAYHQSQELQSYTDISPLASFTDIDNLALPEAKERELIHGYYACVSYIDAQLGLLLDAIEDKGWWQNTAIVVWGDHGWHLGDHGLWNKHSNFEQATRVPLLIALPGISPQKVKCPVEFLDIFPTLCDLVKSTPQQELHGTSLLPVICGRPYEGNQYAVSQYPRGGLMGYSMRTQRYRYTVWVKHGSVIERDNVQAEELYDYEADPLETRNVIGEAEYKKAADLMRTYWEDYKSSVRGKYNR